jgi:hypothetical protein
MSYLPSSHCFKWTYAVPRRIRVFKTHARRSVVPAAGVFEKDSDKSFSFVLAYNDESELISHKQNS